VKHSPKKISRRGGVKRIVDPGVHGVNIMLFVVILNDWAQKADINDLLILDRLKVHRNPRCLAILEENSIQWLFTPPKLSYICSPLDALERL